MPSDGPAVEVRHLERRFGHFVAVSDLNLTVARGEIFGFLGPNGAGKSTTIRMLCGLLRPTSGTGTVAGFDLYRQSAAIKSHIGYMSQRFSLYDDLTVDENLDFYGGVYGLSGARLQARKRSALTEIEFGDRASVLTGDLPAGLKQRLALASAVLHEPPILFLDEPTSGADPLARRLFWDLIHDFAVRGTTVFVSTHYMEEAEYCDRLGLITRGELIALGTPEELRSAYRDAVIDIRCDRPQEVLGAVAAVEGVTSVALFGPGLHVVAPQAAAQALVVRLEADLRRLGRPEARVERVAPSMEDVFIDLLEARDRAAAREGTP